MQNPFLRAAQAQVAVAKGQIIDHPALCLIGGSCLSVITFWLLSHRLAVVLMSR
jgi:hypothetical protein